MSVRLGLNMIEGRSESVIQLQCSEERGTFFICPFGSHPRGIKPIPLANLSAIGYILRRSRALSRSSGAITLDAALQKPLVGNPRILGHALPT